MLANVPRVGHTFFMSNFSRHAIRLVLDMDASDRAQFEAMLSELNHAMSKSAMLPPGHPAKADRENLAKQNFIAQHDL